MDINEKPVVSPSRGTIAALILAAFGIFSWEIKTVPLFFASLGLILLFTGTPRDNTKRPLYIPAFIICLILLIASLIGTVYELYVNFNNMQLMAEIDKLWLSMYGTTYSEMMKELLGLIFEF